MSKITSTIWEIEPHTEAKHEILRKYLDAWLPIITRWNGRVLYIDGFAGPGEYIGGKCGSPIIAIKSVMEQKMKIASEIKMLFIEADEKRCEYLKQKVDSLKGIPSNIETECICAKFDEKLKEILEYIDGQKGKLAPAFVFIDPFGFTGFPFSLIKRIMQNERCEVLINFMYEEINRFVGEEKLWPGLTETFGTEKWKNVIPEKDPKKRMEILHGIYKEQLEKEAGIKYVRSFKMMNKMNKIDYFLFFGTNMMTGLEKMKEAMWRVDKSGNFQFNDATYNTFQGILFEPSPRISELKKNIMEKFEGKSISSKQLGDFIVVSTPFLRSHYKTSILKPMESVNPPTIEVFNRKRKGTYPDDCIIKFL